MEIGTIPLKEEKPLATPLNIYSVEYTSYNQFHKDCLQLEHSKMIVPTIFNKNGCETTIFHYAGEFIAAKPNQKILETDGYLVTYLMYNEPGYYFAHTCNSKIAWQEAMNYVHPSIEKIVLNRYRLVKEWRDALIQPFRLNLKYIKPHYLKSI